MDVNARSVGTQAVGWAMFGNEALTVMWDCRWVIALCVIFLVVDYWWGCRESKVRYEIARMAGDKRGMDTYRFRFSRAGRRTINKFVDFLTYLLIGMVLGMAITEPYGIADHVQTAAIGVCVGCAFDFSSIIGHVCFVHGVEFSWSGIWRVVRTFLINLVRKKSKDVGDALDETFNKEVKNGTENH